MIGIKKLIIVGAIILTMMMSIGLLLPRKISIAKAVVITGETDCATGLISDFKQWPQWFPVLKENLGEQQILSDDDSRIVTNAGGEINFHFQKRTGDSIRLLMSSPAANPMQLLFVIRREGDGPKRLNLIVNTTLKWYPWERIKGVFLDKITGQQYQEAIDNIAVHCR